ncbi:MAG: nitrile hydratase subunit beta [Alphaproteobacteria bacterium]|nr:nitrile hydratase subunit beta [Alphaproteobacteria bacterium]
MGGMHGFGAVEQEADEPVFHEKWESRVYAMNRAMGPLRLWTIDEGRAAQEALPPSVYVSATYYQRWLLGLERRVQEHNLAGADELEAGRSLRTNDRPNRIFEVDDANNLTRGNFERDTATSPQFKAGDQVRTLNINPDTHTRLPRYARDKIGVVEAVRGCHVYPDSVATGAGEDPQWLYTVVFPGSVLWGEDSDPSVDVSIEAFEPYLEPA